MQRSAGDSGYALTMALAVAASQPGRAWSPTLFYEALVLRPTAGGAWARSLRARKSDVHVLSKLTGLLERARLFAGAQEPIVCRADTLVEVAAVREAVERHPWRGSKGGVDERNLTAHLARCKRAGARRFGAAARGGRGVCEVHGGGQQPPAGGGGLARAGEAARRYGDCVALRVSLVLLRPRGLGLVVWVRRQDIGQLRGAGGVPMMHEAARRRDSRALAAVMGHDAFHHWAHGGSGAWLLSCLDPLDGESQRDLAEAVGLHRITVKWRMDRLVEDGLAELADDLYYLPRHLADHAGLDADQEELERGSDGLGERRRQRHAQQRAAYQRYLE
ncbi:winged helix-turn-helix domain-containing protein [Streptomyces klenkii]|uniref:winged helix-turn-helix domain-containing protein n=1 Tax=Streptomyces klenkii TaxID=1420899 RepID=UPI0033B6E4FC